MSRIHAVLMVALAAAIAAPLMGQSVSAKRSVGELIATIQSNASYKEKADACRQLSREGTKEAVPALAAMLADEKLAHMARYALEPMPDPAVDEVLRAALGRLKGRPLVGVICSLGARRDGKAAPLLAKLLRDGNPDVAQAAARALGRVGTADAAKALREALPGATGTNRLAVCEGLLRCAAALAAEGHRDEAIAIYDHLRSLPGPHQVCAGATCAAIVARQKDGLTLLAQQLRSQDYALFAAAVRAAQQMPGPEVGSVLTDALGQLPDERQIPVIQATGTRRDQAAAPALAARAKASSKPVRLAAIRSLGELGQTAILPVFLESLRDPDRDVAQAALDGVAALRGKEVDAAVLAMLGGGDASGRLTALELIGRRRITSSIAALLKAAGETDPKIRSAAMRRLGELGGPTEFSPLLDMLVRAAEPQDLSAVEESLAGVLARLEHPESYVGKLAAPLAQAQPAQKGSLLRILGLIGGPGALKAVRASAADANGEVQAAALRVLGAWKTPDVAPHLLAVAKSADNPNHKMLALRAYLGWAGRADLPTDQRLAVCRNAAPLALRTEEKRLLLSALGNVDSPEAMALIIPHLSEAATKNEAAAAAAASAERVLKRPDAARVAAQLVGPLEKVSQASVAPDLDQRAKAALQQARDKARK
jgi:HEAT repeat protein